MNLHAYLCTLSVGHAMFSSPLFLGCFFSTMNNHNSASFECTGRTENLLVRVVLGGPFCLPSCCIVRIEVDEEDDEDDEEAEDVEEDSEEMEDGG